MILLVVDVQKGITNDRLYAYENCIGNITELINTARSNNVEVIYVQHDDGPSSGFSIGDKAFEIAGDRIVGLHCHISQARSLKAWKKRAETMLRIADRYFGEEGPEYIDLGSGMYGMMNETLKEQFSDVPSYKDYAETVAGMFAKHYTGSKKPKLFTEPGTTLINKYIEFTCRVESIKHIKGKSFVTLNGSKNNLGEICELKKLPLRVEHKGNDKENLKDAFLMGYTCLEHDVMYKGFDGELAIGDLITFENVGGYSLVSKPPFIKPNCAMYTDEGKLIKRQETDEEIFQTYE